MINEAGLPEQIQFNLFALCLLGIISAGRYSVLQYIRVEVCGAAVAVFIQLVYEWFYEWSFEELLFGVGCPIKQ